MMAPERPAAAPVRTLILLLSSLLCGCASPPQPDADPASELDRVIPLDASEWRFGDSRAALSGIADEVRDASDEEVRRAAVEQQLIKLLDSPHATPDGSAFICRQLARIGSDACVPSLARLLPDPLLSHMARYALECIESDSAGAALRAAVSELTGKQRIGVIHSIAARRDALAIKRLDNLPDVDPATLDAILDAFGAIGNRAAATTLIAELEKAENGESTAAVVTVLHAIARCADHLRQSDDAAGKASAQRLYALLDSDGRADRFRIAGLRGRAALAPLETVPDLVNLLRSDDILWQQTASSLLDTMSGDGIDQALAAALVEVDPDVRVRLIGVLARRGDPRSLEALGSEATSSGNEAVRSAAIEALGRIGTAETVPLLASLAAAGDARATQSLHALRAVGVDAAIARSLDSADPAERRIAATALGVRGATTELHALLGVAEIETDSAVRTAVLTSLARIGARDRRRGAGTIARALSFSRENDEVRLLLRESATAGDADVLRVLEPYLRDSSVGFEAAQAMVGIAGRVGADHPTEAREAIDAVMRHLQDDPRVRRLAGTVVNGLEPSVGFVTSWQYAGPYSQDGVDGAGMLDTPLAPEVDGAAMERAWRTPPREAYADGVLDLNRIDPGTDMVGYVRTTIRSAYSQEARLELGSDDGLAVWWNGREVHRNNVMRGLTVGSDIVPVTLEEGSNTLLVKISQGGGDWKVCCRLRDPDGFTLTNITCEGPLTGTASR